MERSNDSIKQQITANSQRSVTDDELAQPHVNRNVLVGEKTLPSDREANRLDLNVSNLNSGFPEGGFKAWLCVFGGWCAMFGTYGFVNTLGAVLAYYTKGPFASYSPSTVSWLITVQIFLQSGSSIFWGRLYDLYGPRWLMLGGTVLYIFGLMMTSLATEYYQVLLAQSILSSLGSGAIFNVSLSSATTWFLKRRAAALGILVSGSSLGGVLFPILFNHLLPWVGFPWTLRIMTFIIATLCGVACFTVKSRFKPRPRSLRAKDYLLPLTEPAFLYTTIAGFLFLWGMFLPMNYITLQAQEVGVSPQLAQYLLAILNGAG
ncbi:hypothetical protein S7711_03601 [Stachybotrys chartarum IBT 7711]|uniref:Major facilitator superfamily (MFS) profile domain-containing protein n=1 Tax=Stachybotrys chartarum (strain CBS 109288 / IBT 7711) TaxID=1280523 RepID=A0A084AGV6_STACB|nr:hypothetical protein S7711_03601 [Stachybotrys chartarum IBT 7711]